MDLQAAAATEPLETIDLRDWSGDCAPQDRRRAIQALERGKVVFFPHLAFKPSPDELRFFHADASDGQAKNVSFDPRADKIGGASATGQDLDDLRAFLRRFSERSRELVAGLFPNYATHLEQGRTSFRPVSVDGRKTASYRKDDRRLHVDAFPSQPLQGRRILRVFANVNPEDAPRVWRVGEPFADYARRFLSPAAPTPPGLAPLLALLGITKGRRTRYDQIMLSLHDRAKADEAYQRDAPRAEIRFPAASTWIVFTDCVPHAVVTGQHALEQTFYLPVAAMNDPELAPLRILERMTAQRLAH